MSKKEKNVLQQLARSLAQEISDVEASNLRGGELLAHELTHVVQQVGSVTPAQTQVSLISVRR